MLCHSFRQFYCLKHVYEGYDSFRHFGCLIPVYDKTVYTGLYRGIYRPLSETAGPGIVCDGTKMMSNEFFSDWLINRRHCPQQWQGSALVVREKINEAIQDMPPVEEITKLLQGTCKSWFYKDVWKQS